MHGNVTEATERANCLTPMCGEELARRSDTKAKKTKGTGIAISEVIQARLAGALFLTRFNSRLI